MRVRRLRRKPLAAPTDGPYSRLATKWLKINNVRLHRVAQGKGADHEKQRHRSSPAEDHRLRPMRNLQVGIWHQRHVIDDDVERGEAAKTVHKIKPPHSRP